MRTRRLRGAPLLIGAALALQFVLACTAPVQGATTGERRPEAAPTARPSLIGGELDDVTLVEARFRTGLPLPDAATLGSWRFVRAGHSRSDPVSAIHLRYERSAGDLLVVVYPSRMFRPDLTGLRSETVTVSGRVGTIVWGHQRVPVPTGLIVDPRVFDDQLSLLFSHENSLVTFIGDQRTITRSDLTDLMAEWIARAR